MGFASIPFALQGLRQMAQTPAVAFPKTFRSGGHNGDSQ